jgi:hypothetical protein
MHLINLAQRSPTSEITRDCIMQPFTVLAALSSPYLAEAAAVFAHFMVLPSFHLNLPPRYIAKPKDRSATPRALASVTGKITLLWPKRPILMPLL